MALIVVGAVALLLMLSGLAIQLITGPSTRTGASIVVLLVLGLFMVLMDSKSLKRPKK